MELRPYQKEAVDVGVEFLRNGKMKDRPIIIAPTAGGKSLIIARMAHELQTGVLVIQPSKELLEQNYAKYVMYGGQASIYSASVGQKEVGDVTFATIGSIVKTPYLFEDVKYVIIDECHMVPPKSGSMFMRFLGTMEGVRVLGLTATAFRLKKYRDPFSNEVYSQVNLLPRERPHFFNHFLHVTQIGDLYEQGYLCPIRYLPLAWENGQLRYNTTGADFTERSMDEALKTQRIHERIPEIIQQSIDKGRKHRLVFVKNVADAERLAMEVPNSAFVCALTKKKEREQILNGFRNGDIKTVFNVGVLTTGFDFPALDTIIMARPTLSLELYMQMVGRGIRLAPGKEDCAVVDMVGNIERFSRIEEIEYVQDEKNNWMLHDGKRQLSGVKI